MPGVASGALAVAVWRDLPEASVKGIDPRPLLLGWQAVPDGGEGDVLAPVDHHPPGGAEGLADGKDLAWWPGNDFSLEPAVLGTTPGVNLPDQIGGDATDVPDQGVFEFAITDWAAQRSLDLHAVTRRVL